MHLDKRRDDLAAWFLAASRAAFEKHAVNLLHGLVADDFGVAARSARLPGITDALFRWVHERQMLLGPLGLEHISSQFVACCATELVAALSPDMLEVVLAYFGQILRIGDSGELRLDVDGTRVAAQLRVLGLDGLVQSVVTRTATRVLGDLAREAADSPVSLKTQVHPALAAVLRNQLVPALMSLLDASPTSGFELQPIGDLWDVSVSHDESSRVAQADADALLKRLDYALAQALGEVRTAQLFDIVGQYPSSQPALEDLKACLEKTADKAMIVREFGHSLRARLLHPGTDTHEIVVYYTNLVYALRVVDASGVVLSQLLPPVQRYLRTRKDTIRVVVAALLGTDPAFALLRTELESTAHSSAPLAHWGDVDPYSRSEYWSDANWAPRPVDAGPEYNQMRSRDVVDLLVSIFSDRDGFIQALEEHTARQLVQISHYDTARVMQNHAIFTRRFGASSLHHCEIMLGDVHTSRELDAAFHVGGAAHDETTAALHPLVISRQFWPDTEAPSLTMPPRLAQSLDTFVSHYARTQPKRRLRWLLHLGSVDVEVEMDDRTVSLRVSPLQAAVIEFAASAAEGASDACIITADDTAAELSLDRPAALGALRFWAGHGALQELSDGAPGSFEVRR
ncbi:hypothetical protein MCUN1_001907 [Malassezia cuniculi]|uniref:Cullin family profile domain-containing protein n=1 Tax=Malassezia cuniculi TaxID=948313 RepID=A0AAF0EV31_9BASI|nr:hypothetical protein MCUN1_001907 [Malassezia cuniculi]